MKTNLIIIIIAIVSSNMTCAQKISDDSLKRRMLSGFDIMNRSFYDELKLTIATRGKEGYLFRDIYFYDSLKKYTSQLLPIFENFKEGNYDYKCRVLGLLDIPNKLKDSLLQWAGTPSPVKARLGDQLAEKKTIDDFWNEVNNPRGGTSFGDATDNLFYVNSENTVNELLKALSSSKIYSNEEKTKQVSLCVYMLNAFSRKYPTDFILYTYKLRQYFDDEPKKKYTEAELKAYFKEVERFFNNKFGANVKVSVPFLSKGLSKPWEGEY